MIAFDIPPEMKNQGQCTISVDVKGQTSEARAIHIVP
jgi:hypothetical protein